MPQYVAHYMYYQAVHVLFVPLLESSASLTIIFLGFSHRVTIIISVCCFAQVSNIFGLAIALHWAAGSTIALSNWFLILAFT